MLPESKNHFARHLDSPDEIAEFNRTAPITTRGYFDLADAVHMQSEGLEQAEEAVAEELKARNPAQDRSPIVQGIKRAVAEETLRRR